MCFCGEFWKETSRTLGEPGKEASIVYEVVYEKEAKTTILHSFILFNKHKK